MKKLKIGVYFANSGYYDIDLKSPEEGNPGIGGTQFNALTLVYYYQHYYPENEIILFADKNELLPDTIRIVECNNLENAIIKANDNSLDIFIYQPSGYTEFYKKKIFELINKVENTKFIAWINNTPIEDICDSIAIEENIVRLVCAGRAQQDRLRDHPVFYKSQTIYNGFDAKPYNPKARIEKTKSVLFIGSLTKFKGFHILAKIWKDIIQEVPDAVLDVVGSGKLYNNDAKLGKFGLAEETYENEFMQHLTDEDGNILKNVVFHGLLGTEKIELLQKATVCVPNPTAISEICPASAIEPQACETAVVTKKKFGFLDTVWDKNSGFLVTNEQQLIEKIVYLLKNPDVAERMGKKGPEFIDKHFNQKIICQQWHALFLDIENDSEKTYKHNYRFLFLEDNAKREFMRLTKLLFPNTRALTPLRFRPKMPNWKGLIGLTTKQILKK